MGYLKGKMRHAITHKMLYDKNIDLVLYCDSDFAGRNAGRKSTTEWIGIFNGFTLTQVSRKQTYAARSADESDYIALSDCARESQRVQIPLAELSFDMTSPVVMRVGNSAANG